jgi:DNA-damage-inducible protein J
MLQATELSDSLGLDLSSAVNIFLRQCILRGGFPFAVELPKYNQEILEVMAEVRRISRDSSVKGYTSMDNMNAALEADDLCIGLSLTTAYKSINLCITWS